MGFPKVNLELGSGESEEQWTVWGHLLPGKTPLLIPSESEGSPTVMSPAEQTVKSEEEKVKSHAAARFREGRGESNVATPVAASRVRSTRVHGNLGA